MKLSTREDIEASIDQVFAAVTDAEAYEKMLTERGAQISRLHADQVMGPDAGWNVNFRFRGRVRDMKARVSTYEPKENFAVKTSSNAFDGELTVTLVPLAQGRTRAIVTIDVRPKTLSSRLLVQSMKLAKKSITGKLSDKVAEFARNIEQQNKAAAA